MCSTVRIGPFFFFFTIEFLNKRKDIDMEKEMNELKHQ